MKELTITPLLGTTTAESKKVAANFSTADLSQFDLTDKEHSQLMLPNQPQADEHESEAAFVLPLAWQGAHLMKSSSTGTAGALPTQQDEMQETVTKAVTPVVQDNLTLLETKPVTTQISTKLTASPWTLTAVNLASEGSPATYSEVRQAQLSKPHAATTFNAIKSPMQIAVSAQSLQVVGTVENTSGQSSDAIEVNALGSNTASQVTAPSAVQPQSPMDPVNSVMSVEPRANKSLEVLGQIPSGLHMPQLQAELSTDKLMQTSAKKVSLEVASKAQLAASPNSLTPSSLTHNPVTENGRIVTTLPVFAAESTQPIQQWRAESLPSNTSEWGQRLLNVLHDKVNLQIGQQVQRAQIRLDPPNLGNIDISISVEGEKTSVHIVASNPQVREAMQQTLDQLKQSLTNTEQSAVDVDISDKQQQQTPHQAAQENQIATNHLNEQQGAQASTAIKRDWLNRLI